MSRRAALALAASIAIAATSSLPAMALEGGGYLKAAWFWFDSPLDTPLRDDHGTGVLRFRLDLRGEAGLVRFEVSPEARLSVSPERAAHSSPPFGGSPAGVLDLERVFLDEDGRTGTLALDRLSVRFDAGPVQVAAGRQPVGFGAGLFWSPTDLVAPFGPLELDREVRPGTDALRVLFSPTPLSELGALWAPGPDFEGDSLLAHARFPAGPAESFLVGGLVRERGVLAGSMTGEWLGSGLRVEGRMLETRTPGGKRSWEGVVIGGFDRRFDNGLYLALEYLKNGHGAAGESGYRRVALEEPASLGLSPFLGRDYLLGRLARRLHPLVEGSVTAYWNIRDGSLLAWPQASLSLSDEAVGTVFVMLPAGRGGTEYGDEPRTVGLWVTLHF